MRDKYDILSEVEVEKYPLVEVLIDIRDFLFEISESLKEIKNKK